MVNLSQKPKGFAIEGRYTMIWNSLRINDMQENTDLAGSLFLVLPVSKSTWFSPPGSLVWYFDLYRAASRKQLCRNPYSVQESLRTPPLQIHCWNTDRLGVYVAWDKETWNFAFNLLTMLLITEPGLIKTEIERCTTSSIFWIFEIWSRW